MVVIKVSGLPVLVVCYGPGNDSPLLLLPIYKVTLLHSILILCRGK